MEAASVSDVFVSTKETAFCHSPEDFDLILLVEFTSNPVM
jgi:hypothetical protein